jgi:hypothetical protein
MDFDLFDHFETNASTSAVQDIDKVQLRKRKIDNSSSKQYDESLTTNFGNDNQTTAIEKYSALPDDYCGKVEKEIRLPEFKEFHDSNNFIILYDESSKDKAECISDVLIFRLLLSHLPDKINELG